MQVEGRHEDGSEEGEPKDADGYEAEVELILGGNGDAAVELIDEPADEATPEEADGDVARIVDAKIEPGVTVDERVADKEEGEHPLPDEQGEEDGNAERVGSMGGEESVLTTAVAVHRIDQMTNLRVVSGSPAGHKGFHNTVVDGSCQQVAESGGCEDKNYLAEVLVSLQHDVEKSHVEGYPRLRIGQRQDDVVEELRVAAVHHQQQLLVKLYDFFHVVLMS